MEDVNKQNGTHPQKVEQGMLQLPEKRKEKSYLIITDLQTINLSPRPLKT